MRPASCSCRRCPSGRSPGWRSGAACAPFSAWRGRRTDRRRIAMWLTRQHTGLFRSRLGGQAMAVLVDRDRSVRGPRRSRGERAGPGAPGRAGGADRGSRCRREHPPLAAVGSARSAPGGAGAGASLRRARRPARRGARDRRRPQPRPARRSPATRGAGRGSTTSSSQASRRHRSRSGRRSDACRMASCCPTTHRWNGCVG